MALEGLTEELQGNESLASFEDVSSLAEGYLSSQAKLGDWKSGLDDDLKEEKSLDAIKDVSGLAKSYVEAQKLIGTREEGTVKLPKDDATPEEWAEFYGKMGRPDDVPGYEFAKPDDLPGGVEWDEGRVDWFGKVAHELGISKKTAQALMGKWNENEFGLAHEAQKAMKKETDGLREAWGDKYDGNIELGFRGIEHLLSSAEDVKEFKAVMDNSGLGNKTVVLKAFCAMGKILKEDGYIIGDPVHGILGADSAKAKINEIYADKKHPWHTGDKAATDEMTQLYKIAHPTRKSAGAL